MVDEKGKGPAASGFSAVEGEKDSLVQAFCARRDFYDLLAALYFKPLSAQQVEAFAGYDLHPYAEVNEAMAEGVNHIVRYLARRNTGTRQELAVDYTSSFGGLSTYEGLYAVPVQSVFTSAEGLMYQQSYHQVHEIFEREGIVRAEGYDYPDDHLSFLFEYLSQQSGRIADFVRADDPVSALRLVLHCRQFIDEHVASWFPLFRQRAEQLVTTRFYRGVLALTQGYLDFDRGLLEQMADALEEANGAAVCKEVA